MGSSLHPLAGSIELDLGALLYAIRRLPDAIFRARLVVMGQSAEVFAQRGFRPFSEWTEVSAPGRRRRWYDDGDGTLAVLIASASDVDDLIPTMVALQIELNKLQVALRGAGIERLEDATPGEVAAACGGLEDDWLQLYEIWGVAFGAAAHADRGARHGAAGAHARRHPGRLRARDPPLVAAGDRADALRVAPRPAGVLREQQLARDRQPAHRGRAAPRRRARGGGRSRRWRRVARRAAALPRRHRAGPLEQLPVLRGARAPPPPARLRTSRAPPRGARSGLAERHQPDRARRRRAGHPPRPAHPGALRRAGAADRCRPRSPRAAR